MPTQLTTSAFALAFGFTLLMTPLIRALALRTSAVARPRADRWHRGTIPLLGGTAVWISALATAAILGLLDASMAPIVLTGTGMCFVGVVDDLVHLKPSTKITAQIAAACIVIVLGATLNVTASPVLNSILTIGWIVWITNAVNLLDNMDGLCAGVVAIASLAFAVSQGTRPESAAYAIAIAGACVGFLVFNFNPASIFLGDAGSLFLGSTVAVLGMGGDPAGPVSLTSTLIVPSLLLLIPLFDSAFVAVSRKLSARSASVGGRDHTSHRLVAMGFSERTAVLLLYALAALGAAAGVGLQHTAISEAPVILGLLLLGLLLLGLHLSRVKVYGGEDFTLLRNRAYTPLLLEITYKRRVFEVLLDFGLIAFSYYAAYVIRFDKDFSLYYPLLVRSLPIVIAAQLVSFFVVGVYRPVWRYFSASDLATYLRGIVVGTVASVLTLLYLYRFEGYSRGVFIIYAMMLGLLLVGSRASFRILADVASRHASGENGALIYGAGDGGALVVRELRNNPAYGLRPLGFIDDDPARARRRVLGITVEGTIDQIETVMGRLQPSALVLSTAKILPDRLHRVEEACAVQGVRVLRLDLRLTEIEPQVKRRTEL